MAWVNPWLMVFRHLPRVPHYSVVVYIMKFYRHDRDSNPFGQQFCDELVESCDSFFYQYLLPEIVSHRILKTKASNHPKVGEDNELAELVDVGQHNHPNMTVTAQASICICQNIDCEVGSYHYGCVEIRRKPKGKWLCRDCLEQ